MSLRFLFDSQIYSYLKCKNKISQCLKFKVSQWFIFYFYFFYNYESTRNTLVFFMKIDIYRYCIIHKNKVYDTFFFHLSISLYLHRTIFVTIDLLKKFFVKIFFETNLR